MICPSPDDWRRYDLGQLDPRSQAEWTSHLESCQTCSEALQSLDIGIDPFLAQLHRAGAGEAQTDEELQVLMQRAAALPLLETDPWMTESFKVDTWSDKLSSNRHQESIGLPQITGYQLTRMLGRGGMGIVYQAEHLALRRQVAIKTLREGQLADEGQVTRFHREAEAAAALDHPNIVTVFEVGQSEGLHYFSMAYVEGTSLEQRVRSEPFSVQQSAQIVRHLSDAVAYAHQRGIVHRDLKPDNVLLDASGSPHITDFGLARRGDTEERLTLTGQVMGTLGYMSPEQAKGDREVGAASDIYSLGAILYRLLVGRPPCESHIVAEALQSIISVEPPRPRSLRPSLDRDIETICLKCLCKEPSQRYASAGELSADLRRYLGREPILARPVGRAARMVRWCHRKPVAAAGIAVVVLLLGVAGGLAVHGRHNAGELHLQQRWSALRERLSNLQSFEPDGEVRQLIASLAEIDSAQVELAHDEYRAALRQLWQRRLTEPQRMTLAEVDLLEDALQALDAARVPDVEGLRSMLALRRADWQTEFHLTPASGGPPEIHRQISVHRELLWPPRDRKSKQREWLTPVVSSAACEMQVEYAEGWQQHLPLGILLSADKTGAYEFLVRRDDTATWAEIRRDGVLLFRDTVGLPAAGPLKIWARRDQQRLSMQVADLPVFDFEDALTARTNANLVFGLIWPAEVGATEIRARRRLLPNVPTLLERADQLLAQGQAATALQQYELALTPAVSPAARAELLHKQGICQALLARDSTAIELFQQAIALNDPHWSPRAACELWQLHILANDLRGAELVLDQVRALDFRQVATLVPTPVRQRILKAYQESSGGIGTLLKPDPARAEKARLAIEVESRLSATGEPSHKGLMHLYQAYEFMGQTQAARQTLERLLALKVDHGLTGYYSHFYARSFRLSGDYERTLKEIQRYKPRTGSIDGYWLEFETVFVYAAREEWQVAHDKLTALLDQNGIEAFSGFEPVQAMLALGFFKHRLNRPEEGLEVWRSTVRTFRGRLNLSTVAGNELVSFLAMAALAGELTLDDLEPLWARADTSGVGSLASQFLPRDTLLSTMQAAWTTPRGRQLAEQLAYDQLSRSDRMRRCLQLFGATYVQRGAFPVMVSSEQEQLVWELADGAYLHAIEAGTIDPAAIGGLLTVWANKFDLGLSVWQSSVSSALPEALRGRIAYVIGMRFKTRGKAQAADVLLSQAREFAVSQSDDLLKSVLTE